MKDSELRSAGPPDTFDNTMLGNYLCPRQLYFFLRRLEQSVTPPYFTFGRAFGQGINQWHETQNSSMSFAERVFLAQEEAKRIWQEEAPIEKKNDSFSNLTNMISLYCELYSQPEPWNMIAAEIGFRLPVQGTEIYYAGSLDAYIEWPGYGLLTREDKTTGAYLTEGFIAQWSHATQITGYIWALDQTIGEMPFGALMNMASKRPRKDDMLRFGRNLETRSAHKIKHFMTETITIADSIRTQWNPGQWTWPKLGERNPMMCVGGMGRSPCAYRNICILDTEPWEMPDDHEFSLHGLAENPRPWEPWEREGDDDQY